MAFLSPEGLASLGLAGIGEDVLIDEQAVFFGAARITIGHRTRIDAQCIISAGPGGVQIGNNVHIAAGCYLFAGVEPIRLGHYVGLSSRVSAYSSSDDYVEGHLSNPTVPMEYRKLDDRPVTLEDHALVGSGCVLLPGAQLGVGATVGALSVVTKPVAAYAVAGGNPMRVVGTHEPGLTASLRTEYERRLRDEGRAL